MEFTSTRDGRVKISGARAIVEGISKADGGLFVPSAFPHIPLEEICDMLLMEYPERAAFIMAKFLTEFTVEELTEICADAYSRFDDENFTPAPVSKIDENLFMLELWHGPTSAFKDMALTVLPGLMALSKKKLGVKDETLILTATSGDTGKAALEGFSDAPGCKIMVLYPAGGVSEIQRLQMCTQAGSNVKVYGIEGNFDDAQTAVKTVFANAGFNGKLKERGTTLSSANSINIGRLLPQIVYYFSAYCDLLEAEEIYIGDKVSFCVPSGNFGNILAGYYACRMGLPVKNLICASNRNNVLTDFFSTGSYDTDREFYRTISPSMDILVSSNLERLIFELSGRDADKTRERMDALKSGGKYALSAAELRQAGALFKAGFASESETGDTIDNFFEEYGYLADPHTAVAIAVYNGCCLQGAGDEPTVIVSTANPYKFSSDVLSALSLSSAGDPFKGFKRLCSATALPVPQNLEELEGAKERFTEVIKTHELIKKIEEFLDE